MQQRSFLRASIKVLKLRWGLWSQPPASSLIRGDKPILLGVGKYDLPALRQLMGSLDVSSRSADNKSDAEESYVVQSLCPLEVEISQLGQFSDLERAVHLAEAHYQPVFIPILAHGEIFRHFSRNAESLLCTVVHRNNLFADLPKEQKAAIEMLLFGLATMKGTNPSVYADTQSIGKSLLSFAKSAYPEAHTGPINHPPASTRWLVLTPDGYPLLALPPVSHNCDSLPSKASLLLQMLQHTAHGWEYNQLGLHYDAITQAAKRRDLEKDFVPADGSALFRVGHHAMRTIQSTVEAVLHRFHALVGNLQYSIVRHFISAVQLSSMQSLEAQFGAAEARANFCEIGSVLADFLYFTQIFPQTLTQEKKIEKMALQAHCALLCIAADLIRSVQRDFGGASEIRKILKSSSENSSDYDEPKIQKALERAYTLLHISRVICFNYSKRSSALRANSANGNDSTVKQVADRSTEANACCEEFVEKGQAESTTLPINPKFAREMATDCIKSAELIIRRVAPTFEVDLDSTGSERMENIPKTVYPNGHLWSQFLRCLLLSPTVAHRLASIHLIRNIFLPNFTKTGADTLKFSAPISVYDLPVSNLPDGINDANLNTYASVAALFLDAYEQTGDMAFLQLAEDTQAAIDLKFYFANTDHDIYSKIIQTQGKSPEVPKPKQKETKHPFLPSKQPRQPQQKKVIRSGTYQDIPFVQDMLFPVIQENSAVALALRTSIRLMHMQPDSGKSEKFEKVENTLKRLHKGILVGPVAHAALTRPLMYYLMSFGHLACWQTIFVHRPTGAEKGTAGEIAESFDARWPAVGCRTVVSMPNGRRQEESAQTAFLFHPFSSNPVYTNYTAYSPAVTLTRGKAVTASIDTMEKMKAMLQTWEGTDEGEEMVSEAGSTEAQERADRGSV